MLLPGGGSKVVRIGMAWTGSVMLVTSRDCVNEPTS